MNRQQIIAVLKDCKHRDWKLVIIPPYPTDFEKHVVRFHWRFETECSKTGKRLPLVAPTHRVFEGQTEEQVVQEVRAAIHEVLLHEADEFFRYRGVMVFDPHIGDPGYEPERTLTVRKPFSLADARYACVSSEDCRLPIRVDSGLETIPINPDEYKRYR